MSDYQPKVGDRVMVGEHGPYTVTALSGEDSEYVQIEIPTEMPRKFRSVLPDWLTPAPEPEPDEPTAFGALVELKRGLVAARTTGSDDFPWFITGSKAFYSWAGVREKGVVRAILANPAEVEALRSEVESLTDLLSEWKAHEAHRAKQRDEAGARADDLLHERDELQRRIDRAQMLVDDPGYWSTYSQTRPMMNDILRGES